ncbi:hypothetical protein QCA50_005696 [Cerrena zonata]|uniref:Uncharacterized protein n=1 Tax=Cerrena zonata TaxID=2478898 RepID=A0AAW0GKY9_9APHY
MSLQNLPVELLYEIFMYGQSEHFPHVCHHFYAVFKSAPTSILSHYLISRHYGLNLIVKSLRYPFCNESIIEAILRDLPSSLNRGDVLWETELPRRIFRTLQPKSSSASTSLAGSKRRRGQTVSGWREDDEPLPFLRFLFNHERLRKPTVNHCQGYGLTKAVFAGHLPLIRFLLDHGADPGCKDGLAVMVAIKKRDLSLVKLLIEPDTTPVVDGEEGHDRKRQRTDREKDSKPNRAKRRKLEDRVRINSDMLKTAVRCDARDIVEYFMNEKGCVPDMQTLMMMSS